MSNIWLLTTHGVLQYRSECTIAGCFFSTTFVPASWWFDISSYINSNLTRSPSLKLFHAYRISRWKCCRCRPINFHAQDSTKLQGRGEVIIRRSKISEPYWSRSQFNTNLFMIIRQHNMYSKGSCWGCCGFAFSVVRRSRIQFIRAAPSLSFNIF